MVARRKSEPNPLVVMSTRRGVEPIRVEARHWQLAKAHAVNMLLIYEELQPGDRLIVTAGE